MRLLYHKKGVQLENGVFKIPRIEQKKTNQNRGVRPEELHELSKVLVFFDFGFDSFHTCSHLVRNPEGRGREQNQQCRKYWDQRCSRIAGDELWKLGESALKQALQKRVRGIASFLIRLIRQILPECSICTRGI